MRLDSFIAVADRLFSSDRRPKPFDALAALAEIRAGHSDLGSMRHHLRRRVEALAQARDPVQAAFAVDLTALPPKHVQRTRKGELMLGQLLLGTLAELAFEAIYRRRLGKSEFRLDDHRESRSDTDYRVLNGGGRPLFRINSKFHGSRFRNAREMVGLEPDDCFPLATYKIWSATQKEAEEHLPYLFLVISTPIKSEDVVALIPTEYRDIARLVHASEVASGKRDIEERIVKALLTQPGPLDAEVAGWTAQLAVARWLVVSARRADKLLRELLFERVFAVRTRNFNQAFRNAEIDMHFSLSRDMTPLDDVLDVLAREGSQGVVGRAMRGVI